jgi:hypothetical protein
MLLCRFSRMLVRNANWILASRQSGTGLNGYAKVFMARYHIKTFSINCRLSTMPYRMPTMV